MTNHWTEGWLTCWVGRSRAVRDFILLLRMGYNLKLTNVNFWNYPFNFFEQWLQRVTEIHRKWNCAKGGSTLYLNSINDGFLKISCNVKSETISMNFSYSVKLKFIGLSYVLMDLLSMHYSVTLSISRLENSASLSYADLSNIDTFYYTVFLNSLLLISPPTL